MESKNKANAGLSLLILCILCLAAAAPAVQAKADNGAAPLIEKPPVVHQLRIYEIPRENKDVFHDRFHKHAMRIMDKYDFNIVSIWETEYDQKTEFAYLLEWPDEKTMKAQWEKFMADQEWKDIKKKTGKAHGRFVNAIEDRKLTLTSYSPSKVLKH
ncbi:MULTISPECIES: NIPSNAP family protein [unclassified Microbulbifer]|uniref:NIPSNAP family protein n=1 Tax=unclassified Microbulbifer TaxID=2619833 RepID=UPI0027E4F5CA|nr:MULTISPECIES: NIPSNAP family protein [unclassified Microbulbifer]